MKPKTRLFEDWTAVEIMKTKARSRRGMVAGESVSRRRAEVSRLMHQEMSTSEVTVVSRASLAVEKKSVVRGRKKRGRRKVSRGRERLLMRTVNFLRASCIDVSKRFEEGKVKSGTEGLKLVVRGGDERYI